MCIFYNNRALHWACGGGHEDTAEMLLKLYNKNVNAKNHFGDTPLHRAAWRGFDKVSLILECPLTNILGL